jgi:hypothetical protein
MPKCVDNIIVASPVSFLTPVGPSSLLRAARAAAVSDEPVDHTNEDMTWKKILTLVNKNIPINTTLVLGRVKDSSSHDSILFSFFAGEREDSSLCQGVASRSLARVISEKDKMSFFAG